MNWLEVVNWVTWIPISSTFFAVAIGAVQGDVNRIKYDRKKVNIKIPAKPSAVLMCTLLVHGVLLYYYLQQIGYIQLFAIEVSKARGFTAWIVEWQFLLFNFMVAILLTRAYFVCLEFDRGLYQGDRKLHIFLDDNRLLRIIDFIVRMFIISLIYITIAALFPNIISGNNELISPLLKDCEKIIGVIYPDMYSCLKEQAAHLDKTDLANIPLQNMFKQYYTNLQPLLFLLGSMIFWPVMYYFILSKQTSPDLKKLRKPFLMQAVIAVLALTSVFFLGLWVLTVTDNVYPSYGSNIYPHTQALAKKIDIHLYAWLTIITSSISLFFIAARVWNDTKIARIIFKETDLKLLIRKK